MPKYLDQTGLARYHGNVEKRPVQTFDTVSAMQAATWLKAGMTCHTNGFHASGDGGAAYYTVSASGTADDIYSFQISNGCIAKRIYRDNNSISDQYAVSTGSANYDIFECAKTWIYNNTNLYYGSDGMPNSFNRVNGVNTQVTEPKSGTVVDGKYPINCMAFVMMCLMGIGFEQSAFGDGSNTPMYPRAVIDFASDELCEYWSHDSRSPTYSDNDTYRNVLTWEFAEYLYDRGQYHRLQDTWSKRSLQTGDIVFFANPNNTHPERFDNISHCAIFVGYGRLNSICFIDATDAVSDKTVRVRWATSSEIANMCGYARIPTYSPRHSSTKKLTNCKVSGDTRLNASYKEDVLLDRPLNEWDIYAVDLLVSYDDASDAETTFPAVQLLSEQYTISRLNAGSSIAFEDGKPSKVTLFVVLSPELHTIADTDALRATFYPAPSSANQGKFHVNVMAVYPIMTKENGNHIDASLPKLSDTYASNEDLAADVITKYGSYLIAGQSFTTKKLFTINNSPVTAFIKFNKSSSSRYSVLVLNSADAGLLRDHYNGSDHDTTYTIAAPAPQFSRM